MNLEEKKAIVGDLVEKIQKTGHFYLTDIGGLDALSTSDLRRKCFEKDIELLVVKNTLLKKALEQLDGEYNELYSTLTGNTAVMFCEVGNVPAKLIKEIRKGNEKPVLKSAYVEEAVYVGDDQLEALSTIKSKDELLGDVIGLLQSPIKNLLGSLESGKNTITGLLKALEDRA